MYKKILPYLCIFLLVLPVFSAIQTFQETSSVSRIVGESPTELLRQLQRNDLVLTHATYYTTDTIYNNYKGYMLKELFGSNIQGNLNMFGGIYTSFSFNSVKDTVNKKLHNNELFILEAEGDVKPLYASSIYDRLYPKDLKDWQDKFAENNPFMIFDSPYAGIYLPKEDNFVSRLVRDTTIIAPSSFNSPQFTNSLLCELVNGKTVGEVFRDARNFHYNGGSNSNGENYIGLVLQSYALYGNPRQKIFMDWTESDLSKIKGYCKNFLENLAGDIEYLGQVGNYSKFRKHIIFEIPYYDVEDQDNFSIINATNTFLNKEYGELVLPMAVRTTHFPKSTIILNYSVNYVGNPVELTIDNLPSYDGSGFVDRECYYETQNYSVEFGNSYNEDNQDFIAKIIPVDVISCYNGSFRLYRKFNYSVDYIAISPALVKEVNSPLQKNINEKIDVNIELMPLTRQPVNGSLIIFDKDNNKMYEIETNTSVLYYNASFYAQPNEGLQKYSAEFVYNNQTVSYKEFYVYTTILEPKADIPVTVGSNPTISINLYSYYNTSFELKARYYLSNNNTIVKEENFTKSINQGENIQPISFTGLTKKNQSYSLTLEMSYLNQKRVITYVLNTNNVPIIVLDYSPVYNERDLIKINYSIVDYENDSVIVQINDTRFTKQGESYALQTNYSSQGNYSVKISANDNYIISERVISFEVKDVVPPFNLFGSIRYQNSSLAEDNLSLSAYIGNIFIANTQTKDGNYNITLPGDNLQTVEIEGGKEGDIIEILLETYPTDKNATWHSGVSSRLDLVTIDQCFNIQCADYCNGTTSYESGSCYSGSCYYIKEENSDRCGAGNCTPNWILNNTWSQCDKTDYQYKKYYDTNNCRKNIWCYQETSNKSTSCGGLDTGSYSYSGNFIESLPVNNAYDGDWDSFTYGYTTPTYFYVNYSKPLTMISGSLWKIKHGDVPSLYNITLPQICLNQNKLQLRVESSYYVGNDMRISQPACYNGTSWQNIGQRFEYPEAGISWLYEEALWWNMTNPPSEKQSCNYCTSTWTQNGNSGCWKNNSFLQYYRYNNTCCAETGLASDCNMPLNDIFYCDYCTPNWVLGNTGCLKNNSMIVVYKDANNCYNQTNLTSDLEGRPSNYSDWCDYCIPSWNNITSECVNGFRNISYYFANNCCAETGLASDCNAIPRNSTVECTYSFMNNISLKQGWNLFSLSLNSGDGSDKNITLNKGWNLFGYSSNKPFYWLNATVNNKTSTKNITEAGSLSWVQPTIYCFNETSQNYEVIPGNDDYLRPNKGYWLYSLKDDLTLILSKAGSSQENISFYWLSSNLLNGADITTIESQENLIQPTIYYYAKTYKFVPDDSQFIYPWTGYWIYSFNDNINLIVSK